ncbi:MAG: protease complex subunit PrcB family protein [Spirochaetaceae bacterium]|nr:MAG: protease complex subunit PrcB family protein [Spirochaetaceae bacterium]
MRNILARSPASVLLLAAGLALLSGCFTAERSASGPEAVREPVRVVDQGNAGDRRSQVHVFRTAEQLEAAPLPEDLRRSVAQLIDFPREAALIFFAGTRTTGGYSLDLGEVSRGDGRIVIRITEIPPAPDAMVTQALSYPHVVIAIEDPPPSIVVEGPDR